MLQFYAWRNMSALAIGLNLAPRHYLSFCTDGVRVVKHCNCHNHIRSQFLCILEKIMREALNINLMMFGFSSRGVNRGVKGKNSGVIFFGGVFCCNCDADRHWKIQFDWSTAREDCLSESIIFVENFDRNLLPRKTESDGIENSEDYEWFSMIILEKSVVKRRGNVLELCVNFV